MYRLVLILTCLFGCAACNSSVHEVSSTSIKKVPNEPTPLAAEITQATLRAGNAHFRFTSKDENGHTTVESEGAFSQSQNCGWSTVRSGSDALEFRTIQAVHYVGVTAAEAVDGMRWIRIDSNALNELLGRQIAPELTKSISTGDVVPTITKLAQTFRTGEFKAQLDNQPGTAWLDSSNRLVRYELQLDGRTFTAELSDFGTPVTCAAPAESETVDYVQLMQAIKSQMDQ